MPIDLEKLLMKLEGFHCPIETYHEIKVLIKELKLAREVVNSSKAQLQICEPWSEYPSYFEELEKSLKAYDDATNGGDK